jgi:hypothetical protein
LRSQRLESGPVFLLQRREPFQHLGHEGRAGIGRGPFDEALQGGSRTSSASSMVARLGSPVR